MISPDDPRLDRVYLSGEVADYLAVCRVAALDSRYHPTAAGALKVIFHRTPAEADVIRAEFARQRLPIETHEN